jgi:negative regulator of sigma-B (phosphoserine phosphatase)
MTLQKASIAQWGFASRPRPGEEISGDRHLVLELPGSLLMAVVDGAGHGPEAAAATDAAVQTLSKAPPSMPVADLMNLCHARMRGTRGGVISLGRIEAQDHSLHWVGVGNVEGAVFRAISAKTAPSRLQLRNGVVGMWLPVLKPATLSLAPGDTVVFTTDGIDSRFFANELPPMDDSQELAEKILRQHSRTDDDALALVVRYTGASL